MKKCCKCKNIKAVLKVDTNLTHNKIYWVRDEWFMGTISDSCQEVSLQQKRRGPINTAI